MMKRRHPGRDAARLLIVVTMSTGLVACGGGGGDDEPIDGGFDPDDSGFEGFDEFDQDDVDGDGIPNGQDPDYDPSDLDGDLIPNLEDDDVDGDGVLNEGDPDFVENDADGDGFSDPTDEEPCGPTGGSDADSSNNPWNDNCLVERFNPFADSLYTAGIQRIVYCTTDSVAGDSVDAFTDGEFGPGTRDAVVAYQAANTLGNDGVVGAQTWASLQDDLELVERAVFEDDAPYYDAYAVAGERCGDTVLFYNEVAPGDDGVTVDRLGWALARGASSPEPVPFSIAEPFGIID